MTGYPVTFVPTVDDLRLNALIRLEIAATTILFAPSSAAWDELAQARRAALTAINLVGRTQGDSYE